jgi:phosphomannomutase
VDTSDGCRFDMPEGWVHLRTSNTEPVMRAILETRDSEVAKRYLEVIDQIRLEVFDG